MSRRAFVVFFGALLAAPIADRAQPAGTTAAATVLDARPQQIASLRTHCVPLSDPYVADVKRICRVNVFRAMGTVNGKRIYFALYRRLVVLPQDDVPVGADHSQAGSQVDRPPFVNTAVVIFEESEPDKARPILAAANEGYLGNEWFNEPRSIDRDGKHLIVISRMVGSILEEDYYRFQNGAWVTEDATKVKWPFSDYPMIDRPAVVTGLGAVLATPLATEGQQAGKVYRVGYLSSSATIIEPFRHALRELGYIEGQNLVIDPRLAAGKIDRLPALAAELARARVDVIAAVSPPAIAAAKGATTAIPIVMAFISVDPVQSGFVESLGRPGGNITGVAMIADDIAGKRLALLREMLPRSTRIALLAQVNHSSSTTQAKAAREAAGALGVELEVVEARDSHDYEVALGAVTKPTAGLFILANPTFYDDRKRLAALAVKHRLASLCEWREMAEAGCLMSYGPNISDLYRRVGTYLDRILKGANPGDLPIEQPTKFELVINLKTAKALGLTIPLSLLLRADQVIE